MSKTEHIHARDTGTEKEWGANTKQAHPDYPLGSDDDYPRGWHNKHTDADEIRRKFGISPFDVGDYEKYETPYPNALVHTVHGDYFGHKGGTNLLAVGEKGSGKSTLGLFASARLMDDTLVVPAWTVDGVDDDAGPQTVEKDPEAVVWRGQPSASEWLPYKNWAHVHVPRNGGHIATWESNDMRDAGSEQVRLSEVAREVSYYDDPRDLNQSLKPGTFNVVYPDPSFTGCEEIMAESDYCPEFVPFTPGWEAEEPGDTTPLVHWWFAYMVSKLEHGPYDWTTLMFDECADLAPQGAKEGRNQTYTKIKALRKVMAHSRKHYFSPFFFGHHEANLHDKVRRTIQWRIDMPDGTANRNQNDGHKVPVGFSKIPMYHDMLSAKPVGYGVCWTETNFTRFRWPDVPKQPADDGRWLKVRLGEPGMEESA